MGPVVADLAWIFGCTPWREEARTWAPEQAAISKQLRAQARPLSATGAGIDVEPLWAMTREARIIGIGEATHGTREFREVMNAMVKRASSDDRPVVVALRLVWLAQQRVDASVAEGSTEITERRDLLMADNVRWISDQVPDALILLNAHNGHIARARGRMSNGRMSQGPVMGIALSGHFGDEYVAVHTAFDHGSFLAYHTRSPLAARWPRIRELRSFPVDPAPRGTLEATLREPGVYVLDVRTAEVGEGALARYLRTEHWARWHTFAWRRSYALVPVGWSKRVPTESFDVLVYFARGSATTPWVARGARKGR